MSGKTEPPHKGIANVLGNIGAIYYMKGNYALALDYMFQSLRIFEKINNPLGIGNELSAIGNVYMEQGMLDKAIHYDTLAIRQYEALDNKNNKATVLGNLGNIFRNQGNVVQAKAAYYEAIDIYKKLGVPLGLGRNLTNLATLLRSEGNFKDAHRLSEEALSLFNQAKFSPGICYATTEMGINYYESYTNFNRRDSGYVVVSGEKNQLLQQAILLLKEAVRMAQQSGDLEALNSSAQYLSLAFEANHDAPAALTFFKISTTARDSLRSVESKKQIEKLTTERELELRNKQIELDRLAVEKKRNERLYFLIGIGLLLLTLLFVYRNYANQRQSNRKLSEFNTQIADKNQQLSQTLFELRETQAQLIETEKQKETAIVRGRISQDIHDDLGAGLSKIAWLTEGFMKETILSHPSTDIGPLEKVQAYAMETMAKLTEIIWSSNPERDNLDSLLSYLRRYAHNFMEDAPMRCLINLPDEVPDIQLHPEMRRNLYLVVKEALHNARKYSMADEVRLSFTLEQMSYCFEIADNGVGLNTVGVQGSGNGFNNMQQRMAALGGKMNVLSAPDVGTSIVFVGEFDSI